MSDPKLSKSVDLVCISNTSWVLLLPEESHFEKHCPTPARSSTEAGACLIPEGRPGGEAKASTRENAYRTTGLIINGSTHEAVSNK